MFVVVDTTVSSCYNLTRVERFKNGTGDNIA